MSTLVLGERRVRMAALAGTVAIAVACVGCASARTHHEAPRPQTLAIAVHTTRQVSVPRLIGLGEDRATCEVVAAGLRWRLGPAGEVYGRGLRCHVTGPRPMLPLVAGQWPHAGARVRPGSVVTLILKKEGVLITQPGGL
jgi:hypothetical protein